MASDRPGSEIPKQYREVATALVADQGWRYDASGKGHPKLYPADPAQPLLPVPTTPSASPRSFKNWVAQVRLRGGEWPPRRH